MSIPRGKTKVFVNTAAGLVIKAR